MRLARFQLPGILLASALGLFGCQQGLGGRCVQDSDCSSGHCSAQGETAQGGICQAETTGTTTGTGGTVGTGGAAGAAGGAGGMSGSDGSTDAPGPDAENGGAGGGAGGAGGSGAHDAASD